MKNIALILRYDGSRYHGWQVQKNEISVAQTLEEALTKTCGHPVKTVGCGRTDAGVHALRYCANFRSDTRIPLERLPLAVNARLPGDIAVLEAVEAPEDFNAIGSCIKKEYVYKILNSNIRDPFLQQRVCFYPQHLNMELMQRAGRAFEGTHDFRAVRSEGTQTKTTVRTVYDVRVEERLFTAAEGTGREIDIFVTGNGFLYNMVRIIAGTLWEVGTGRREVDSVARAITSMDRATAGKTAPAHGLYLEQVFYE